MNIESVKIENFRCFKDETVQFNNYTCFVGANGSGKSTILNALNIFFRQYKDCKTDLSKLTILDFHHKNIEEPIKITVTFSGLSAEAKNELSDYVRLDKLVISSVAHYDKNTEKAEVKQYGNRMGFEEFRQYFEADKIGKKVDELKVIYKQLARKYGDLPKPGSKSEMKQSLIDYEKAHPKDCILIPSEDQFYGISKGVNRLEPYIQWVFVSATKDATEECDESKASALGQLLERTVRSKVNFSERIKELKQKTQEQYQGILDLEQSKLDDISEALKKRLQSWSHPGISAQILWKQDPDKSVKVEEPWAFIRLGERGFEGELPRFGHGLQRSYLLALLQELTTISDEKAPTLIMGIEEPEIYQHPPQARYLAETLHELSKTNSQIIVCSHNPLFIPGDNFEAVRIVREEGSPSYSYTAQLTYSDLSNKLKEDGQTAFKEEGMMAKLYPSLNPIINEMFFCKVLILTEGVEDIGYITTYLMLNKKFDYFRRSGCHIVPVGGKNQIIKPLAMANLLKIPVYVVFDTDRDKTKPAEVTKHKQDNRAIQKLLDVKSIDEWPSGMLSGNNFTMWAPNLTDALNSELGVEWQKIKDKAYVYYGNPGGLQKNPLAIARALEEAWDANIKSTLLQKMIDDIVAFIGNVR